MKNNESYHIPVMLPECIDALNINSSGVYVDVTFGGGSHSRAIFEKLGPEGKLISFDQDQDAKKNTWDAPNFDFVAANFAYISNHLRLLGIQKVDGILADLGMSSFQLDNAHRGFSFQNEGPLDMRMDTSQSLTAEEIINTWDEKKLSSIFWEYGEEKKSRLFAKTIVQERKTT